MLVRWRVDVGAGQADRGGSGFGKDDRLVEVAAPQRQQAQQGHGFQVKGASDAGAPKAQRPRARAARVGASEQVVEQLGADAALRSPLLAGRRVVPSWRAGAQVDEGTGEDSVA
jgi:hypothetical protein